MDIATIAGIASGIFLVVYAIVLRGTGIGQFLDFTSAMITFGGAFAATLVNYPLKQVVRVFKIARNVLMQKEEDPTEVIEKFVSLTKIANKNGILAVEKELKGIQNEFFRRGVQLVVDGADQDRIRQELETEITFVQERHSIGQEIFVVLGTYSPAFGMIGTIIGLVMMLAKLEDQSQIAAGMAVALLTTFYGAMAAYLVFLPIAGKLKRRSEDEILIKQVIIQGIMSLQDGELPSIMESKLKAYLPRHMREKKVTMTKPAPGKTPAPEKR